MDDESITIALTIGDEADQTNAIENLWVKYREQITRFVRNQIQGMERNTDITEAAHDIVVSVFVAFQKQAFSGDLGEVRNIYPYLLGIASNKLRDFCRKSMNKNEYLLTPDAEDQLSLDELVLAISGKLAGTETGDIWKTINANSLTDSFRAYVNSGSLPPIQYRVARIMALALPDTLSEEEVVRYGKRLGYDLTAGQVKSARQQLRKKFNSYLNGGR